jgi:hypothetical protein
VRPACRGYSRSYFCVIPHNYVIRLASFLPGIRQCTIVRGSVSFVILEAGQVGMYASDVSPSDANQCRVFEVITSYHFHSRLASLSLPDLGHAHVRGSVRHLSDWNTDKLKCVRLRAMRIAYPRAKMVRTCGPLSPDTCAHLEPQKYFRYGACTAGSVLSGFVYLSS